MQRSKGRASRPIFHAADVVISRWIRSGLRRGACNDAFGRRAILFGLCCRVLHLGCIEPCSIQRQGARKSRPLASRQVRRPAHRRVHGEERGARPRHGDRPGALYPALGGLRPGERDRRPTRLDQDDVEHRPNDPGLHRRRRVPALRGRQARHPRSGRQVRGEPARRLGQDHALRAAAARLWHSRLSRQPELQGRPELQAGRPDRPGGGQAGALQGGYRRPHERHGLPAARPGHRTRRRHVVPRLRDPQPDRAAQAAQHHVCRGFCRKVLPR